jgi:hypothetical protein
MIRAASDGAIYGTNLKTGTASDDIYKVYKWDNESAAPTNTLTNTVLSGARLGDDLDLTGSAGGTLLVAGFAPGSTSPAGSNGYAVMPTARASPTLPSRWRRRLAALPSAISDLELHSPMPTA